MPLLGTLVGRAPRSLRLVQRARRLRSDITYGANDADVDALIEESLVGWAGWPPAAALPACRHRPCHQS